MTDLDNPNPFAPPKAAVADVIPGEGESFQPVRMFSAKGRMGRLRYYAYLIGGYFVYIIAAFIVGFVFGFAGSPGIVAVVVYAMLIPYLVLTILWTIQRSHDMDWSGWMMLLALIPLVSLIWLFRSGTPGANRFGPPPPPNSTGVKVLAGIGIVLSVVVILLAILMPAIFLGAYSR